jgi:hypothetical protein
VEGVCFLHHKEEAMSDDVQAKLRAMEARLKALEDQLAIYQLVTTYGPAVDSLNESLTQSLWTEDGVYDPGTSRFEGSRGLSDLIHSAPHQGYVKQGSAHVTTLPHVEVNGDTAVATCYSQLYLHEGDQWRVARTSSNRWELVRTPQGWKIKLRTNRLLNGDDEARGLFRKTFGSRA